MIPESRLYSFIDNKSGFTLQFLEGQKLIHDLAIIHTLTGKGFAYFRDSVLSVQPMISFLKPTEGIGIYIDSKEPEFNLKLETSAAGNMRTLLIPEEFDAFPEKINGICRLTKISKTSPRPYTSHIELRNINFHSVVNKLLKESYQIEAEIIISEDSDQSIMLMKLPSQNANIVSPQPTITLEEFKNKHKNSFNNLFSKALVEQDDIKTEFQALGLTLLGDREVKFKCACSRERMISGLKSLANPDDAFEPGKENLEVRCDYCKTFYLITKSDLQ